ncbi:chromatin remodelling complex Rsc7/Swp82 subunit-domain-containing protein [Gigaspora margarita]|uniref:Chromatin remodelling complex Rsc7/Swp82 subunit-domain-containing protein n=1 Tax=Gigaspora margarita TaxID=4874 RepID=A0A8H4AMG1_GIGMA|nr:chromatin remodelling complex Rsc7/Swp82 subunit-domain-containing protein [Gigaspora margarita]
MLGRKFKVPVFQLLARGKTWYMCSMDPSKVLGFRDSYTFFTKNSSLKRLTATNEERDYLIATGLIPTNLRSRPISLVSARSIFMLFGSKIIQGGKKRQDDYYESRFEAETNDNDQNSETESINIALPKRMINNHMTINKNININDPLSWMYRLSLSTRDFNTRLKLSRKDGIKFYDPHTNTEQVPRDIQPTRIRTEMISLTRNNAIIEPEIKFDTISRNPLGILRPEVMNVLPPDIQKIVEVMNNEEITLHKENEYPIALTEGQFQASYPLHNSRFQPDPSTKATKFTAPYIPSFSAPTNEDQFYNQNNNQNGKSGLQFSKANPQYICAVITATTGMPCRRAVTANGERCMYHRSTPSVTCYTDGKLYANPEPGVSHLVQQTVVAESCATTADSNVQLHTVSTDIVPSEDACAQCLSVTVPPTTISPDGVLPCSNDYTIKCSHCRRKFHPLCLTLSHSRLSRLLIAMESYQWQCNDCKTCVVCRSSGDEATLLICDDCDRGWHLDCSSPKVTQVPSELWLCSLCAQCDSCGEKAASLNDAASNYHHVKTTDATNYPIHLATICNKCHGNFTRDLFCPICLKTYSEDGQENDDDKYMVCCDGCDRWVHTRCDETLTPEKYQELADIPDAKYMCPLCEGRIRPLEEGNKEQQKALSGNPLATPVAITPSHPIRGIISYKGKKVAVPEIRGWEKN